MRDHHTEKERFKGLFDVWTEEIMREAEKQGVDVEEESPVLLTEEAKDKKDSGVDERAVVADMVL